MEGGVDRRSGGSRAKVTTAGSFSSGPCGVEPLLTHPYARPRAPPANERSRTTIFFGDGAPNPRNLRPHPYPTASSRLRRIDSKIVTVSSVASNRKLPKRLAIDEGGLDEERWGFAPLRSRKETTIP